MSALDDLREIVGAGAEILDGVQRVTHAASAAADTLDGVLDHLGQPEMVERIVTATASAAVTAATHAVRVGASRPASLKPPAAPAAVNQLQCPEHGITEWQGTIVCKACGRVFQVADCDAPHAAPELCTCGAKLLPSTREGKERGTPICSTCVQPGDRARRVG
jgi:hypothetical protein